MAQSLGYGFAAFAMLFQLAIYAAVAYVIWKFYQIVSKMGEDIAAIRTAVTRPGGDPDLPPDYQLPPDHPLMQGPVES